MAGEEGQGGSLLLEKEIYSGKGWLKEQKHLSDFSKSIAVKYIAGTLFFQMATDKV
jgi:hypothetical protein